MRAGEGRGLGAGDSSSDRSTTAMEGFLPGEGELLLEGVMVTLPGRRPPTEGAGRGELCAGRAGAPGATARGWGEGAGLGRAGQIVCGSVQ